jgi:hypothetical protein
MLAQIATIPGRRVPDVMKVLYFYMLTIRSTLAELQHLQSIKLFLSFFKTPYL